MKIVLTGGPCSGKTTLLNRLNEDGYKVVNETAKELIDQGINVNDSYSFQINIVKRQLEKERQAEGLVFFDRGVFDGFYYSEKYLGYVPKTIIDMTKNTKYDLVFIADLLAFKNEGFRLEKSYEEAEIIHEGIMKIYTSLGYSPVPIPVLPIEERTAFVLDRLNKFRGNRGGPI